MLFQCDKAIMYKGSIKKWQFESEFLSFEK